MCDTLSFIFTIWYNLQDILVQRQKGSNTAKYGFFSDKSKVTPRHGVMCDALSFIWTIWYNLQDIFAQRRKGSNTVKYAFFQIDKDKVTPRQCDDTLFFYLGNLVQYARHFGTDTKRFKQRKISFSMKKAEVGIHVKSDGIFIL